MTPLVLFHNCLDICQDLIRRALGRDRLDSFARWPRHPHFGPLPARRSCSVSTRSRDTRRLTRPQRPLTRSKRNQLGATLFPLHTVFEFDLGRRHGSAGLGSDCMRDTDVQIGPAQRAHAFTVALRSTPLIACPRDPLDGATHLSSSPLSFRRKVGNRASMCSSKAAR